MKARKRKSFFKKGAAMRNNHSIFLSMCIAFFAQAHEHEELALAHEAQKKVKLQI